MLKRETYTPRRPSPSSFSTVHKHKQDDDNKHTAASQCTNAARACACERGLHRIIALVSDHPWDSWAYEHQRPKMIFLALASSASRVENLVSAFQDFKTVCNSSIDMLSS